MPGFLFVRSDDPGCHVASKWESRIVCQRRQAFEKSFSTVEYFPIFTFVHAREIPDPLTRA
jgi:hypothetical protein